MNPRSFSRRMLLAAAAITLSAPQISAQTTSAATERAIQISLLESRRRFSRLYDLMHPDAKAFIPREVVIGWYNSYVPMPDSLGELSVIGVQVLDWTWQVTGVTYPNTAEVTFVQPVTQNGVTNELRDVIRLAPVAPDDYRWFFGRDAAFVDAQFNLYARPAGSGEFTIRRLGVLPGFDLSSADVINNASIVAGNSSYFGNPGDRGFLQIAGEMHAIDELFGLPDWINYPRDINEAGVVVGGSAPFEGTFTPYMLRSSGFYELPKLEGHNHNIARGINNSGTIVGEAFSFYFDGRPSLEPQAVVWSEIDLINTLPAAGTILSKALGINDNDWIIGVVEKDEASQISERAVIWRGDLDWKLEHLPTVPFGPGNARPLSINNENAIVGITMTPATTPGGIPWIWRTGDTELTPLPLPESVQYLSTLAINNDDIVVGTGYREGGNVGLIWRHGRVAELTDLIDTGSFIVTEANDIADNGLIAGQVQAYGDPRSATAAIISIA